MTRRHGLSRGLSQAPPSLPLTRAIGEAGGGGGPSAFSAAKAAIVADAGDVNILVIGDSTGNETTEWVYLFGQWLASRYPTHSVDYYLWTDGSNAYAAPVSLGTGSGANTINIWNASISGTGPRHLLGSKFTPAVTATGADSVIWNHGKNLTAASVPQIRGEFLAAMEMVRQAIPTAGHSVMLQSPNRDDNAMANVIPILQDIASDYGDVRLADAYSPVIALGKPSSLYADNVHPSAAGTQYYLSAVQQQWNNSSVTASFVVADAFLDVAGTNLLSNSNFGSGYAGGTPSGWVSPGSLVTATVETTIVDSPATQSMKMVGTTAFSSIYFQPANIDSLKGGTATLAVRQFIPSGSASGVGQIGVLYNNGSDVSVFSATGAVGQGGWRWLILSGVPVPSNATFVRAYLYVDAAANASSAVYVDRAILVAGDIPRNL